MAVNYTSILSADLIISELEALTAWRDALLRRNFYGETANGGTPASVPPAQLLAWAERESDRIGADRQSAARLQMVFDDLSRVGQEIAGLQDTMPAALYDRFTAQFAAYVAGIRQLYQELSDKLGAVDPLTGLRTVAGLRAELKREQDRFDRKGTAFSLASIRVDNLDELSRAHHSAHMDAIFAGTARIIAGAIRSFDDAFYIGQGEYLVLLKHVEFMDACSAMDRMCADVGKTAVALPDGSRVEVTVSVGVAEAQEREQPDRVLEFAKGARAEAEAAGGNRVQEYQEKSALEHYARDVNRDR